MQLTNNSMLITGGSSGIGLALAEAFHELGNEVIIAGRRSSALEEVTRRHKGMLSVELDLASYASIESCARKVVALSPKLNVLINNAGIQEVESVFDQPRDLPVTELEMRTNFLGPLRLTAALLPALRLQPQACIMNVTSGLAFIPKSDVATYCATKAALHSYTVSLRYQLAKTSVQVVELIPPQVQTNLRPGYNTDPRGMPLSEYIDEVLSLLKAAPEAEEIVVERCKPIRNAAALGAVSDIFARFNKDLPQQ